MPLFQRSALKEGVSPREAFGWALFDAANSGYSTVVLTAVFNAYFVSKVCGDASWATFLWSCAVGAANALSMVLMPAIGRMADLTATKKKWLVAATMLCVSATALLALSGPGTYVLSVTMLILSYIGYNVGESLNSAFLPEISRPEALGKVSGWGWSLGYVGGLITLGLCLTVVTAGQAQGLGMDALVAATNIITASVFLVVSIPVFLWLKERAIPQVHSAAELKVAMTQDQDKGKTAETLMNFIDFRYLVVCGFFYQCGVATVITLAAVYASAVMGFGLTETLFMVLLVNITAALGAFGFGYVQDRIGHKLALALTLLLWIVATAAAAQTSAVFWVAANLAGLAMGSSQSAGRALVAVFAPEKKLARFYGIWNMALWLSAVIGPITYGAVTWMTGNNQRLAIVVTGLFFVAGLIALIPVKVARGAALAQAENQLHGH